MSKTVNAILAIGAKALLALFWPLWLSPALAQPAPARHVCAAKSASGSPLKHVAVGFFSAEPSARAICAYLDGSALELVTGARCGLSRVDLTGSAAPAGPGGGARMFGFSQCDIRDGDAAACAVTCG